MMYAIHRGNIPTSHEPGTGIDSLVDWALMERPMWKSTREDPDRRERRMAECLAHRSVRWPSIKEIATATQPVADEAGRDWLVWESKYRSVSGPSGPSDDVDGIHMITLEGGNLLDADVDALVNTVNTVGVMGTGLALQFKRAYPAMFRDYSRAAQFGELEVGRMQVWETGELQGPRYIINFPTKRHWRQGSRLVDIEQGLTDLVRVVRVLGIPSVAVPPLGCGNGGLDWAQVEPLITNALTSLADVDVRLFPPGTAARAHPGLRTRGGVAAGCPRAHQDW